MLSSNDITKWITYAPPTLDIISASTYHCPID